MDSCDEIEQRFDSGLGAKWYHRCARMLVGLIPPLGALLLLCHVIILLLGQDWHVASSVFKLSLCGFLLLIILSKVFGFCWVHRLFITYNFIVSCCIEFQHFWGGFGLDSSLGSMSSLSDNPFSLSFSLNSSSSLSCEN